jgi:membrane protease YdiL (CAAX protease family)
VKIDYDNIMLKEYIEEIKQFDFQTGIIIIYSTFVLLFSIYFCRHNPPLTGQYFFDNLIFSGIIYAISPFLLLFVFKFRLKDFGISFGNIKRWPREVLLFFGIMVVILVVAFLFTHLKNVYPLYRRAAHSTDRFLIYQLIKLFYMSSWEFFFRGFMLFGLEKKLGKISIFIQTIPFAIMHYRKPEIEAYGSIFAGIFLGIIAFRARSFLPCAILHFLVALTADILGILL